MNLTAAEWAEAMFDLYGRNLDPRSVHIGPMFKLKNDIESCEPMTVGSVDYKDPERWWI